MNCDCLSKYDEFLKIARLLNENGIVPLLFGSLGLALRLNADYNVDDIDVLISIKYLNKNWQWFKRIIEEQGYILEDLHEHQFRKGKYKIAFANIESLTPFADIDLNRIELIKNDGVKYFLLNLEQYLAVYNASSKDSYRRNKNNNKDFEKIELIKQELYDIKYS